MDREKHWENIYNTKDLKDVSWYQEKPSTSLNLIDKLSVDKHSRIIDIGGGDSLLIDHLLEKGYTNLSVLDISESALNKAKKRLGSRSKLVKWIHADITEFKSDEKFNVWHDRAVFHFLTDEEDIQKYIENAHKYLEVDGIFVLGTFSEKGPIKCSGITIKQYSESEMQKRLDSHFNKIECFNTDHNTPFNTVQNFTFCSFRRKNI